MEALKTKIESAWPKSATEISPDEKEAVVQAVTLLDRGEARVAEPTSTGWQVNEWLKKAILLYFRLHNSRVMELGEFNYFDKVPVKKWSGQEGVRVVPPAVARFGSFIESGAILMPSYVNIGARVGTGSMVDTWATVGSCAQIGKNVHLSGGVGIGGVLEPVQASPVIIEDDAFIGSRCVVVEGVIVEKSAVLGAGCVITASTPIIDVTGSTEVTHKGRIPAYSVVIPGSRTKQFSSGSYQLPCALIIGKRSASTDLKTSLTSALRDFQVPV
jgi:2,3,4,5-tetrahydropyridine-2-carboxylate N-succinyltransferase